MTGRPRSISTANVSVPINLLWATPPQANLYHRYSGDSPCLDDKRKAWLEDLGISPDEIARDTGPPNWTDFAALDRGVPTAYLIHRLNLCRLSDTIASELYSGALEQPWSDLRQKLRHLQHNLHCWREALPDNLAIEEKITIDTCTRARIELSMYYHSVQMMLYRPCLSPVMTEKKLDSLWEFRHKSARACVHAAMSMVALIPERLTAPQAFQILPWWSFLHFLSQATAVLLLELSFGAEHFLEEIPQLLSSVRHAMNHLGCLAQGSVSASRAWMICRRLLAEVVHRHKDFDISDMSCEA
jgi:hypothetical protein